MANHKVLRDLLHVLITEKSVEAQLVCRREKTEVAWGERMDGWRGQEDPINYAPHSEG